MVQCGAYTGLMILSCPSGTLWNLHRSEDSLLTPCLLSGCPVAKNLGCQKGVMGICYKYPHFWKVQEFFFASSGQLELQEREGKVNMSACDGCTIIENILLLNSMHICHKGSACRTDNWINCLTQGCYYNLCGFLAKCIRTNQEFLCVVLVSIS